MDRFSQLQLFVRVVELGSFTRAGAELSLGQPSVSKQVAALEEHLGSQLLDRTSRGIRPTAAGQDLYDSAVRLLDYWEETESRVRGGVRGTMGFVRVAMPPAFGRMFIIPRLPEFYARFPDIVIEFSVAQRRIDLVEDGVDVALRVGTLDSSSFVARRIGSIQTITVASPNYLTTHGTPSNLDELISHKLIVGQTEGATLHWEFKKQNDPVSLEPSGPLRSNDGEDLRAAVIAGIGISHVPSALFHEDIQRGLVVQVLSEFAPDPLPIHAVSSSGHRMAHRTRMLVDFLAATFKNEPSLRLK